MKKNLLLLIFIFPLLTSGQSTWVRTLNVDNMLPAAHQDSVTVGPLEMGITNDKYIMGLFQMDKNHHTNLIKVDSSGDVVFDISVSLHATISSQDCFSFHITNDNGCCYVFRYDSWLDYMKDTIVKRDANGIIQWSLPFTSQSSNLSAHVNSFQPTYYNSYLLQFNDSLVELNSFGQFIRNRFPFSGTITALQDSNMVVVTSAGI